MLTAYCETCVENNCVVEFLAINTDELLKLITQHNRDEHLSIKTAMREIRIDKFNRARQQLLKNINAEPYDPDNIYHEEGGG